MNQFTGYELEELRKALRHILDSQLFGVLSTVAEETPHSTIMAFAVADNWNTLVMVTPRHTRKYQFLKENQKVSFFVDNRSNRMVDTEEVYGIEARGRVSEIDKTDTLVYRDLYLRKFPQMDDFFRSPASACIKISVDSYNIVHHFQDVVVLSLGGDSR